MKCLGKCTDGFSRYENANGQMVLGYCIFCNPGGRRRPDHRKTGDVSKSLEEWIAQFDAESRARGAPSRRG